jgi:hypothetical protein
VPKAGLEPARVSSPPPQDGVSTRFHHFGIYLAISPPSPPRALRDSWTKPKDYLILYFGRLVEPGVLHRKFLARCFLI